MPILVTTEQYTCPRCGKRGEAFLLIEEQGNEKMTGIGHCSHCAAWIPHADQKSVSPKSAGKNT